MPHVAPYHFRSAAGETERRRPRVSVGIVNNMPDAALQATERQFVTLLQSAAEPLAAEPFAAEPFAAEPSAAEPLAMRCDLRIHLFTLPGIPRGTEARERIRARYLDYSALAELRLDALIVTGAVPIAGTITGEDCWPQFTELVDWARANTVSSIWSCFAAHAAAFHLDRIERRPLPRKLSGVYDIVASDDPLTAGLGPRYRVPHSRHNDLAERDLVAAGYDILGRSAAAGVDAFAKATPSRFVLLQGHPEYDGDTLMREYRRDIARFVAGERRKPPDLPDNYFAPALASRIAELSDRAVAARHLDDLTRALDREAGALAAPDWAPHAVRFFRNWIAGMARTIATRSTSASAAA
jgi:homoserine O-succinyltransferase